MTLEQGKEGEDSGRFYILKFATTQKYTDENVVKCTRIHEHSRGEYRLRF